MAPRKLIAWQAAAARAPLIWGALLLTLAYIVRYLGYPAVPGNTTAYPLGWWLWFDQSMYWRSILAFADHNLAASEHFYPLGYPLLGVIFHRATPMHPYFLVDLAGLLVCFLAFVSVARRCGLTPVAAVLLYLATTLGDKFFFLQWVIPWTTSASAPALWALLAVAAAALQGTRRPAVAGVLAALVPMIRPTDLLLTLPALLAVLLAVLRAPSPVKSLARLAGGFSLPLLAYAVLYLRIYGPHESAYMMGAAQTGFTFHDFFWKADVLFINPYPWFWDGTGLLRHAPWLALGLAGLIPAAFNWRRAAVPALLAATIIVHAVLYIAYVDTLPTGLWRYDNVHYWSWLFPAYGLLGWLLLRDVLARGTRRLALGALGATSIILCVHFNPVPAAPGGPAKMLDFPGASASFAGSYFGALTLNDAAGPLRNISDIRVFPIPGGLRAVELTRDVMLPVSWGPGAGPGTPGGAPIAYKIQLGLGRPCWLPGVKCPEPAGSPEMPGF
jgi:hypothetical protein